MESGSGGACKFLRRKCVFAPYFRSEHGPSRFAAIHKVFGANNASKLLLHLPVPDRYDAVLTIAYEAQARISDPVHGCVAHISALQQQVVHLQEELMQMRAQLAADQWPSAAAAVAAEIESPQFPTMQDLVSDYSSSLDSIDGFSAMQSEIMQSRDDEVFSLRRENKRRRLSRAHVSELQEMALLSSYCKKLYDSLLCLVVIISYQHERNQITFMFVCVVSIFVYSIY